MDVSLISAAIGAVATIAAIVVGATLKRRSERWKWRMDARRDGYWQFFEAFREFRGIVSNSIEDGEGTGIRDVRLSCERLRRAMTEVKFVGAWPVVNIADQIWQVARAVEEHNPTADGAKVRIASMDLMNELEERFVLRCRKDLLHSLVWKERIGIRVNKLMVNDELAVRIQRPARSMVENRPDFALGIGLLLGFGVWTGIILSRGGSPLALITGFLSFTGFIVARASLAYPSNPQFKHELTERMRRLRIGNRIDFAGGILFTVVFGVWTFVILNHGFSWWVGVTGLLTIGGLELAERAVVLRDPQTSNSNSSPSAGAAEDGPLGPPAGPSGGEAAA